MAPSVNEMNKWCATINPYFLHYDKMMGATVVIANRFCPELKLKMQVVKEKNGILFDRLFLFY